EDGIRDPLVTGVQTCALPISPSALSRPVTGSAPHLLKRFLVMCSSATPKLLYDPSYLTKLNKYALLGTLICFTTGFAALSDGYEIGRASCRERVWIAGCGVVM